MQLKKLWIFFLLMWTTSAVAEGGLPFIEDNYGKALAAAKR